MSWRATEGSVAIRRSRCEARSTVAISLNKFLRIATSLPATLRSRLRLLLAMTLLLLRLY
jgi:hypothetical protein